MGMHLEITDVARFTAYAREMKLDNAALKAAIAAANQKALIREVCLNGPAVLNGMAPSHAALANFIAGKVKGTVIKVGGKTRVLYLDSAPLSKDEIREMPEFITDFRDKLTKLVPKSALVVDNPPLPVPLMHKRLAAYDRLLKIITRKGKTKGA